MWDMAANVRIRGSGFAPTARPPHPAWVPRTVVMGLEWSSLWPLIPSWPKTRDYKGSWGGAGQVPDLRLGQVG